MSSANDRNKLVKVIEGKKSVVTHEEALWVLKMVSECKDFDIQAKLASSGGLKVLKQVLVVVELKNAVSELLSFMECFMINNTGIMKAIGDSVLETMYKIPMFIEIIGKLLSEGKIAKDRQAVVAWFIVQAQKRISGSADTSINEDVLPVVRYLLNSQPEAFSELKTVFFTQLQGVVGNQYDLETEVTTETPAAAPVPKTFQELKDLVPQHDNDFPLDYRKISIFPTVNELNAKSNKFRVLSIVEASSSTCTEPALMLDRHFRLLREDMLAPLREELATLLDPTDKNKNKNKITKFERPSAIKVEVDKHSGKPYIVLQFVMPTKLRDRVKDMKSKREMQTFFESEGGKKVFPIDSVLVFVTENGVVHIGSVVHRDASAMSHDPKPYQKPKEVKKPDGKPAPAPAPSANALPPPVMQIGVIFFGNAITDILTSLCDPARPRHLADYLVQARSSFFSYEPVLRCLQGNVVQSTFNNRVSRFSFCRYDYCALQRRTSGSPFIGG